VGFGGAAQAPEWFTTAPARAIETTLEKLDVRKEEVGLWEINEAFSVVPMAVNQICDLDPSRVNVHGGAVAMGHPIGASGARIVTTLLYAMEDRDEQRGVASICLGGGEALAMLIER
jgi:acetyl-CoA C-acetyltransferase